MQSRSEDRPGENFGHPLARGLRFPIESAALYLCLSCLILGCCLSIWSAWRWPLVGDASLIRYVVFLMRSGMKPYSNIIDINLPGSYLLEYGAMRLFGWGAHGLRAYDGFLCVCFCTLSYFAGDKEGHERVFCLAGGLLFVLIHLHDGVFQAGQRDDAMAVLALGAVVLLIRRGRLDLTALSFFEALIGLSLTIKPTLLPMTLLPLVLWKTAADRTLKGALRLLSVGSLAAMLPVALMLLWLHSYHSVHAFFDVLRSIDVLHGELGRKSLWWLIQHSVSPVILLFLLWAVLVAAGRPAFDRTRTLLLGASCCGLLSYLEQGKGLAYQRYPFLSIWLVLAFLDYARAARSIGLPRVTAVAALLAVSFGFVPKLTWETMSFDAAAPLQDNLERALPEDGRGGSVQCIDTYGGCINALYDLRIKQATGYLYDCYLFTPPSEIRDSYRREFLSAFDAANPAVVVVTDNQCFHAKRSFDRIKTWPEFDERLRRDYTVRERWASQIRYRWWTHPEVPTAYTVYVHR